MYNKSICAKTYYIELDFTELILLNILIKSYNKLLIILYLISLNTDLLHFSPPIPSSIFPAEEVLKKNVSFLKLTILLLAFGLFLEVVLRFWNSPGLYTPIFWNVIYGVADFTKTFLWA